MQGHALYPLPEGWVLTAFSDKGTGTERIPVKEIGYIVDTATYDSSITQLGWLNGWTGSITAGASNVTST